MKKLAIVLLSAILILVIGCSAPQIKNTPVTHNLKVTVESANDSKVTVQEDKPKYELPNSPYLELSQITGINAAETEAFSKLFSGLSVSDVTRLYGDYLYLKHETEIRNWNIFINSPGGDAFSGLALAATIKHAQKDGFHVIIHASGIVASAAVPVFAVGNERYAMDSTTFMVHEAALWKWPGRETASDIRSQNELMTLLRDSYINILVNNSDTTKEDWEVMEKKTTWFNTDKAKDFGLLGPNKRFK